MARSSGLSLGFRQPLYCRRRCAAPPVRAVITGLARDFPPDEVERQVPDVASARALVNERRPDVPVLLKRRRAVYHDFYGEPAHQYLERAESATLLALGAVIGAVAFSGSCVAFAKLQGLMTKAIRLPGQNNINFLLSVITIGIGLTVAYSAHPGGFEIFLFFVLALALGVILVMPIGGADMPVVISLLNAFTGLAVGFKGFVIGNPALIVAGIVVGASGMLLTQLMAKAMNRPIRNIIFAPITGAAAEGGEAVEGTMRELSSMDAAALMRYGQKVIIVPGYGMAVAGAQHKVWEMAQLLEEGGVEVVFAIHPVAGRMPGHMNVLLAEAGVPYDIISDMDEINAEFANCDVAIVIGANDVVNPAAKTDPSSPIYGMPILDVVKATRTEHPDVIVERVFAALRAHAGEAIRRDDLTLLVART